MAKTLICSNCNAPLPFPEGAVLVQCEFCGATCDLRPTRPPPARSAATAAPTTAEPTSALNEQELHARIKDNPFEIEAYKALRRLYSDKSQHDKAWCLCSALSFLGQADAQELQLYEQRRPGGFVRARARTTDELWSRYLLHPDEDRHIGAVFAVAAPSIAAATARPHKDFKLKRKLRRDLATDQLPLAKMFKYVISVLNLVTPDLFVQKEHSGLSMAHTEEAPAFVAGADLSASRADKELAFIVGKQLSYLRPERFLRRILTAPSQARAALFAASRLANPRFPVPPADAADVDKIKKQLAKVNAGGGERLATAVRRYTEAGSQADVNTWWSAAELSANRIGFVLCNDLGLAAKIVTDEPAEVGALPPKERVKELVAYSVSQEYFQVREHLGLCG